MRCRWALLNFPGNCPPIFAHAQYCVRVWTARGRGFFCLCALIRKSSKNKVSNYYFFCSILSLCQLQGMDFMEVVRRTRVEGVKLTAAGAEEPIVGGTLVVTAFFFIYSTRKQAGQDELIVCPLLCSKLLVMLSQTVCRMCTVHQFLVLSFSTWPLTT